MLQKFHCEHVLQELGESGLYQKWIVFGFLVPLTFLSAFELSNRHNEIVPDHWCRVDLLANFSYGEQHRLIRPKVKLFANETVALSQCKMYDIDYGLVLAGLQIKPNQSKQLRASKKCSNGWFYDRTQFSNNAAIHYNFVCDRSKKIDDIRLVRKISSMVLSPLYGFLSDKYSRRSGLILMMTVVAVSCSVCPLINNQFQVFLASQALNGSAWPMFFFILLVFGIEFFSPRYRSYVVICLAMTFHLSEYIFYLTIQAWSDWYWVAVFKTALIVPGFLLLVYSGPNSVHWLLANKRFLQLKQLFQRINLINSGKLDDECLDSIISKFTHYQRAQQQHLLNSQDRADQFRVNSSQENFIFNQEHQDIKDESSKLSIAKRIKFFIKRSSLFQMVFLLSMILSQNELILDYMTQQQPHHSRRHDDVTQLLIQLIFLLLTCYLIEQRIGRRWSNCLFLLINMIIFLVALLVQSGIKTVAWLEMAISISCIMLARCSILITVMQTLELTCTRYRCTVIGIVECISKLLGFLIMYWINNSNLRFIFNTYIRLILFGLMASLSILIGSFLAETRNEFLPLGQLESEQLITKNVHFWSLSKKKWDFAPSNLFLSLSKWDINENHQIVGSSRHLQKMTDS